MSTFTNLEAERIVAAYLTTTVPLSGNPVANIRESFPNITANWLPTLGEVWNAASDLSARGGEVHFHSVVDQLKTAGQFEKVGKLEGLPAEDQTWPVVKYQLEKLRELHGKRAVAEIAVALGKGMSPDEAIKLLQTLPEAKNKPSSLFDAFNKGTVTFPELKSVGIPPRRKIIGDWFCEADLGFIFAPRGLGKTWFSLGLATAITGKKAFGPWPVLDHAPVLYIDGEMPCESLEGRMAGMGADEELLVLNHESLFHTTGKVLNLTDPEAQDSITRLCLQRGIKVLILDNLSCLFSGIRENEADAWEAVLPWLLTLRRHRVAVMIVAHSGRDGKNMRGTSRREDAAFTVIRLDEVSDKGAERKHGARFISRFTKDRNSKIEQPALEWSFQTGEDGKVSITTKEADGIAVLVQWVEDGLTSATDIASEMGISKGTVSKLAKKAIEAGRLRKEGNSYALAA